MSGEYELFSSIQGYRKVLDPHLAHLRAERPDDYLEALRWYGENDLYALVRYVLSTRNAVREVTGTPLVDHPFILDRCRDVQGAEDGIVDIWAREHFKSTIKTFAKNFFDIIGSKGEITIAIIVNKLKQALTFGHRLRAEMETNELLPILWPEVFWANRDERKAKDESVRWTLGGENPALDVKRLKNVAEPTLAFFGLDSALPTGPHFGKLHFDDIVTRETADSEAALLKSRERWQSCLSLGREGGVESYSGTFYHPLDTYNHQRTLSRENGGSEYDFRVHPCRNEKGRSVFYSDSYLETKRARIGEQEWWTQWMCDPHRGQSRRLQPQWIRYYKVSPETFHPLCCTYILVDPANEKHKKSDYTVIMVIDVGPDGRWRWIDGLRDRLDPSERIDAVLRLYDLWGHEGFIECRYEKYGMQSDNYWLKKRMQQEAKVFPVVSVAGNVSKVDRITRLEPHFKSGTILFPETLVRPMKSRNNAPVDLVDMLIEGEYKRFPLSEHDDMLDCLSRMAEPDMPLIAPSSKRLRKKRRDWWDEAMEERRRQETRGTWISP